MSMHCMQRTSNMSITWKQVASRTALVQIILTFDCSDEIDYYMLVPMSYFTNKYFREMIIGTLTNFTIIFRT
jgi:hypothetical protein